jgi:hypothetical protein
MLLCGDAAADADAEAGEASFNTSSLGFSFSLSE